MPGIVCFGEPLPGDSPPFVAKGMSQAKARLERILGGNLSAKMSFQQTAQNNQRTGMHRTRSIGMRVSSPSPLCGRQNKATPRQRVVALPATNRARLRATEISRLSPANGPLQHLPASLPKSSNRAHRSTGSVFQNSAAAESEKHFTSRRSPP